MKKLYLILAIAAALLAAGCTSADTAVRALEGAGYTSINIEGYTLFGCGEHDVFHTKFTAKGPTGKSVSGVVCAGWLKGATIRTD